MHILQTLASLSVLFFVAVFPNQVDIESDGSFLDEWNPPKPQPKSKSGEHSVIILNSFPDKSIQLFWEDPRSNQDVLMFVIAANTSASLNTFNDHRFYGKVVGMDGRLPDTIHIRQNTEFYSIGPEESRNYRFSVLDGISPQFGVDSSPSPKITVRSDHSGSPLTIIGTRTTAMAAKFRCHCLSVDYWFDDGKSGSFQGSLALGKETTTNTYEGHVFYFTEKGNKSNEIARYEMSKEKSLYIIEDPRNPPPTEIQDLTAKEHEFHAEYYNKTGILWRHYFGPEGPRPPPTLHMWPAGGVGQIHKVTSNQGFWTCDGSAETCQSKEEVQLQLEVASLEPRAFLIPKFLSDFETDEIIRLARPQIHNSLVGDNDGGGARASDTRTSRNAWVGRKSSKVTETLYVRAAHLLNLDEKLLNSHTNAEDMQVVHYVNGQKYDSHHDWGVSGHPESRFITLLLYLTDMADPTAGGETAFPKGADGLGFKVTPRKGSAVLFYNLLEDGNGDDLALHAALPVYRGEKWLANFWVWDPKRK